MPWKYVTRAAGAAKRKNLYGRTASAARSASGYVRRKASGAKRKVAGVRATARKKYGKLAQKTYVKASRSLGNARIRAGAFARKAVSKKYRKRTIAAASGAAIATGGGMYYSSRRKKRKTAVRKRRRY